MNNEEAKDLLDNLIGMVEDNQHHDYDEALKLAIRSLSAWSEVMNELEAEKNKSYESWGFNYLGLKRAINIINQKLAEIEE